MIGLDAPTVLVQWALGVLAWTVLLGRRVSLPYGYRWVIRSFVLVVGGSSIVAARFTGWVWVRDVPTGILFLLILVALILSTRSAFRTTETVEARDDCVDRHANVLDLAGVIAGVVAVVGSAFSVDGSTGLAVIRFVAGTAFLGVLSAAMIFGHRYLAKQRLGREAFERSALAALLLWPVEVGVFLIPTGMVSVFTGAVDDGYAGILGWMWAMCAATTGGLLSLALVILRDKRHQVVASATGIVYLAGMTGFGIDLIARAVLSR